MIAIASPTPPKMTIEEYLAWEAHQELRHEYVNGDIFAMTGGTIPHNDIALNLYTALRQPMRSRSCRINVSDVKVQVTPTSPYYYPDVVVSCDPRDRTARQFIQHPQLIVEVLSPSTESRDRGEKFIHYQAMPSLQEYVLMNSEKIFVEIYRREEGRMWLYSPYQAGETVVLQSLGFEAAIEVFYEGVTFDEPELPEQS